MKGDSCKAGMIEFGLRTVVENWLITIGRAIFVITAVNVVPLWGEARDTSIISWETRPVLSIDITKVTIVALFNSGFNGNQIALTL